MERERKKEPDLDNMLKKVPVIKTGKDDLRQDSDGLDEIYNDAQFVTDELGDLLLETFGKRAQIPKLKDRNAAEEKIANKYFGDASKVRDISLFTVIAKSIKQLINDLTKILNLKKCKVVNLKNKFLTPNALGYRDINLNISFELPDGRTHLCEVQLHLQGIIDVKKATHVHYEAIRRAIPTYIPGVTTEKSDAIQLFIIYQLKRSQTDLIVDSLMKKIGGVFLNA